MEFKFLDLVGEEVFPGDTIVIASLLTRSPRLFLGLITKTSVSKAQARIYYKKISDNIQRDTYITLPMEWSGRPSNEFMKISGAEFHLDQKRFARLFAAKTSFEQEVEEK